MAKSLDLEGFTPEFRKLIISTSPLAPKPDGTHRDVLLTERIHIALAAWLAKQKAGSSGEYA